MGVCSALLDRRFATIALLAGFLILAGAKAPGPPNPKVQGAYRLEFRGFLEGAGNAAVSAKAILINGQVKDPDGNAGQFVSQLPMVDNRFAGKATVLGLEVSLGGRLEPGDDTLKAARLVCTYTISNGKHGRFIGQRK